MIKDLLFQAIWIAEFKPNKNSSHCSLMSLKTYIYHALYKIMRYATMALWREFLMLRIELIMLRIELIMSFIELLMSHMELLISNMELLMPSN